MRAFFVCSLVLLSAHNSVGISFQSITGHYLAQENSKYKETNKFSLQTRKLFIAIHNKKMTMLI